jgi:TonB family protein
LAVVLARQAAVAAPAGLAEAVAGTILAGTTAAGALGTFMSVTKLQMGLASALAVAGAAGFVVQAGANSGLRDEIETVRAELTGWDPLRGENERFARRAAELADLRSDDAELKRLRDEVESLRAKSSVPKSDSRSSEGVGPTAAVHHLSNLDRLPRARLQAAPVYPADAHPAGESGEVVVEFVVDTDGNVSDAFALQSSPRGFAAAAVEAVSKWKFAPGQKGGRLVATRMQVPITFKERKAEAGYLTVTSTSPRNWF